MSSSVSCRIKIFIIVFIILAGVNVASIIFAMRASDDKNYANEVRFALASAMYEMNLASESLTRWMRFVAITGGEFQYNAYWAEIELNRIGQTLEIFTALNAPTVEIELLQRFIRRRAIMNTMSQEIFRLRAEGYIQEAIELAHSPEFAYLGVPLTNMVQELVAITHARTQEMVDSALRRTEVFEVLILLTTILLVLVCFAALAGAAKAGTSRMTRILAMMLVVFAAANIYSTVSTARLNREKSRAFELRTILVAAVYNVEMGTEALTRWARAIAVTGGEFQYGAYRAELELDRFGQALDTFITYRAPDCEVNILVELVGRVIALRQIEAQYIQLRLAGYTQQAIEMAFGPEVAAIGIPTNILSNELRELTAARTRETVDTAWRNYVNFKIVVLVTAVLFIITGLGSLIVILHQIKRGDSARGTALYSPSGIIARMHKRIKNTTITVKLMASFAMIISIFIVYIAFAVLLNTEIDNLNRHYTDFMVERAEIILAYHQEFTEMRRLLHESFMNSEWLETANEGIWRSFEQQISASHARMTQMMAVVYDSIKADQIFPALPDDSRLYLMREIMGYADTIYEIYSTNFFFSGAMNFYHGNVLRYTGAAEIMIQMLRRINAVNREIVLGNIERSRNLSNVVTITVLVAAIFFTLFLAYSMIKSFTGRIKTIEANAVLVEQGDFEATLQNKATDEISQIFTNLVKVFTGLIDEIDGVARENAKGNSQARINAGRFQGGYQRAALVINTLIDTVLEQQEKMQIVQENSNAKSRFLARMSHEIRTPITAVLGISEIHLQNTTLPLEIEGAFAKIYSSANTLLSIINDILDLSKIEAGKMEIFNEKYEVASLLSDIAQLHLAYLGSKRLEFFMDVDERMPTHLIGDALRIKQVLNNLLSNAFKYTVKGNVNLSVHIKDEGQNGYVNMVIVIRDTGRGMNKEQQDALFDEYTRFHEKEARFETGTGLGMSITSGLLQMMDATIEVESEVDKGTTVTIVLPQKTGSSEVLGAEKARNLRTFNADAHSAAKRLPFAPELMPYGRVLIVDDVDTNIYVASGLMKLYQLHIDTCTSGFAAIEKVKSGEVYDIIFMDQMMPDMDGMEAVAHIRQMNYSYPIVALTANALVGHEEMLLKNGFDGFLSKPIQTVHLNAVLHKFVRDRHPEAAGTAGTAEAEYQDINDYFDSYLKNSDIYDRVNKEFVRSQKQTMLEIAKAIDGNDLKTAHRLAHSLKGLAGLIGEKGLLNLAEKTEISFSEGTVPTELVDALGLEMERVITRIEAQYQHEADAPRPDIILDKDKARAVFDKLIPLLEANSFDALELCGELAAIPQTNDLIEHIKGVDFALALKTITDIKRNLEL